MSRSKRACHRFKIIILLASSFFVWNTAIVSAVGLEDRPASASRADNLRTGVAYGDTLYSMNDRLLDEALDSAAELGVQWIRADLSWADVQPSPTVAPSFRRFEHIVSAAASRGLSVLPVLAYTPGWARAADCDNSKCAPKDPSVFATFAAAAAMALAPLGVHTWEVWNEENSADFWRPAPDPAAYGHLLEVTAKSIKRVDSGAQFIMGGLATLRTQGGDMSVSDYVAGVLRSGEFGYADALAVHPYTYPDLPSRLQAWQSPSDPTDSGLRYLEAVLSRSGRPRMPIWITEYGAPTGGVCCAYDASPTDVPDHVSEAQQALIASDAVHTAASEPMIGSLFWYTDRDYAVPDGTNESYYGLRRADGSRKPAYDAYGAAIKRATK